MTVDPLEAGSLRPGIAVPALGLLELSSIALGLKAADTMVKHAPVRAVVAGSVQPGKYLVLVDGDVASVEEAMEAGNRAGAPAVVDRLFLPDVHPAVGNAVGGLRWTGEIDALGVIETRTTAAALKAGDAGMKGAHVHLVDLRLANGLGGKAIVLFAGPQHEVEAAVEIGSGVVDPGNLVQRVVIPRLHEEITSNLSVGTRFSAQWNQSEG